MSPEERRAASRYYKLAPEQRVAIAAQHKAKIAAMSPAKRAADLAHKAAQRRE